MVKKRKRNDKKHKKRVAPKGISDSSLWDGDKTARHNYAQMGLVMNVRPSMRHSNEGKTLQTEARIRVNKKHYEKHGLLNADIDQVEEIDNKKRVQPKTDLT